MLLKSTRRDATQWFPILLENSQGRIYYKAVVAVIDVIDQEENHQICWKKNSKLV
jgi:hypothetical protein